MRRHAHAQKGRRPSRINRQLQIFFVLGCFLSIPCSSVAQESATPMTLRDAVDTAITANLDLQSSGQEIEAARANRNAQQTNLLPTFNVAYQGVRNSSGLSGFAAGATPGVGNTFTVSTGFTQPLFEGFALINQYKVAELGVNVAELSQKFTRLEVIFQIKQAYFNVLKAEKLLDVARNTVTVLEAQEEVARNFFEVGLTPLNDLLQVQVQLANARQNLITAQNNLDTADSQFNVILRRPVNAPVSLVDIQTYASLENELDYYLDLAVRNRLDIKISDLNIQIAEKEVDIARKDYYPSIALQGEYFKTANDWALSDDERFANPDGWSFAAIASWNFWEWGRTKYGESVKRRRFSQAKIARQKTIDQARLEVEVSYLKARESEKNILAVEKAVEQAKENLRITNERYKEQVATSVDTLVAQNLLTSTQVNYFNALYDFKIAEAFLQKAVNLEILE
ncbi:MAG: TolC family protein [Desulfobacterales bacterium]